MIEIKEFFTLYLHLFLRGVYICSTYIPSWCEHLLHLCTFMVCTSTLPVFLHGVFLYVACIPLWYAHWFGYCHQKDPA